MTPEFAYLLKVNVAFVLFYAFYRLFFYKDTFFKLRRAILLAFFGLALFYPLLNIQDWVRQQEPIADVIYMYSAMLPEATAKADAVASVDWYGWLLGSLGFIYWGIVAFLCGRFLVQLSSILWLAHTSERVVIHETPVYALRKAAGPFSFFRMVFLHPESHSDKETDEILTHECTHVSQWHSIDVILSEMMCMACWFNPFVWLLKREVRHNLEYLADNTVIQSGYDSKSYQYHLLGLAHHQSVTTLYNSFNVLHLKNRIMMMNKKRSPGIVRTKYLIFIPLVGILMLLSNIEAVARLTVRLANEATVSNAMVTATGILVDETGQPLIGASVVVKGGKERTITDKKGAFSLEVPANAILRCSYQGRESQEVLAADMTNNTHLSLSSKSREMNEQVFTVVEKMPSFPGGDAELLKYIATNIKYPKESQDNGEQGRVICSFIVGRDGSVNNPEVLRGVTPLLNEEAVRVINTMPRWNPGMQRGKAVAVKYTVPITFRLKSPVEEAKEETLTVVDVMPQYPGGDRELLKFIAQSIKYPTDAQEAGVQGRVICSFVVDKKGNIVEPKIIRGIDPSLDAEALRVIGMMPRWTPGRQDGKAVRVLYTVPITFRLQ
ncbi:MULTISPECIES: M56 family metallopeptidase [Parabacteroides]|uniref:M56 family metallopeptidase n=1 Tax=Parabacteroides TaxID=375288 RepID=UPI0001B28DB3|nr:MULTISPECIES: M56 family metallopeptidase [Parabacteroides]EEU52693.1 TonB-dependent receptor [Parabacteroides sp. D13]MBM6558282.1 TonB family protein [Parabacteroides distasonis]